MLQRTIWGQLLYLTWHRTTQSPPGSPIPPYFPAPPTRLTVRIEASPTPLHRLNDGLARHHAIRNHNFVVFLRLNQEGI